MELVISTDTSVEGVHWPVDFDLLKAADRAVCAALSDLAAMGAGALAAWLNVMARDTRAVEIMGMGGVAALQRYDVELAGGDTSRASINALSATVVGQVPEGRAMRRDRAEAGDAVWLLGKVGFASLGIEQWLGGKQDGYFVQYLDDIHPKLQAGARLLELGVKCCIDVSDGVLQDASHLALASSVGMTLELSSFPGWEILCHKVGEKSAIRAVVSGGEDYALLFTASPGMGWLDSFATRVGVCTDDINVEIQLNGTTLEGLTGGYDHFG